MSEYNDWLQDKQTHEPHFDPSELDPHFAPYFRTGQRVRVETNYGGETRIRTGVVGVTSGWRPAFLLRRRSSDTSSSDLLIPVGEHRITHVRHSRKYEAI